MTTKRKERQIFIRGLIIGSGGMLLTLSALTHLALMFKP